MNIDPTRIPLSEIDHPAVREVAERYHEAVAGLKAAERELAKLDGGRILARERDALAAVEARMAGDKAPKRTHEAAYDKALDEGTYDAEVARQLVNATRHALHTALAEHIDEWREDAEDHAAVVGEAFRAQVAGAIGLWHDLERAHRRRRMLGLPGSEPRFGRVRPSELVDSINGQKLALAPHLSAADRWKQRVLIPMQSLLEALRAAGEPEDLGPAPSFGWVEELRQRFEGMAQVARGYTDEEVRTGKLPPRMQ